LELIDESFQLSEVGRKFLANLLVVHVCVVLTF